ncbi:hypothetical protein [Micromonospora sp. NPDC050200]|uniref:hypothetical protein n=1 Tax=Micromonospora sp. NPDC050200 TaxID=3155664 RepID=UPI00340B2EA0
MQQLRTHDLVLNRAARQRLAILSGYPETLLRAVLSTRQHLYRDDDPQPARHWAALGPRLSGVLRPCTLCAARRDARIPALVRLDRDELPICVRHRRTLVSFRDEQPRRGRPLGRLGPPSEQPLDSTPEILAAVRRYRALRRRRRATLDAGLGVASQIISGWRSWPRRRGESDHIVLRWRERSELLPRVDDQVVRYPETIALAVLFARMPQLLLTPHGSTGDPTPTVFLIHAARYLDHP